MPDRDNTNKGVLFRVKNKKTDNHPDLNGKINIRGQEFWLSGWVNKSDSVGEYFSFAIGKEVEPREETPTQTDNIADVDENEPINLDDIPF